MGVIGNIREEEGERDDSCKDLSKTEKRHASIAIADCRLLDQSCFSAMNVIGKWILDWECFTPLAHSVTMAKRIELERGNQLQPGDDKVRSELGGHYKKATNRQIVHSVRKVVLKL